jgi:hypothetical protein
LSRAGGVEVRPSDAGWVGESHPARRAARIRHAVKWRIVYLVLKERLR